MGNKNDKSTEETSQVPNEDVVNHGGTPPEKSEKKLTDITVDEMILKLNPEMVEQGVKIGDVIQVDLDKTTDAEPTEEELQELIKAGHIIVGNSKEKDNEQIDKAALEALAKYSALYPKNKVFHFTSDGQVFLKNSLLDAKKHQAGCGGELKSYSV